MRKTFKNNIIQEISFFLTKRRQSNTNTTNLVVIIQAKSNELCSQMLYSIFFLIQDVKFEKVCDTIQSFMQVNILGSFTLFKNFLNEA